MVWVLTASFIGSFGAVCLKNGAGRLHRDLTSLIFNYPLFAGIGLYLLSTLFFLKGIQNGELTILYPMVSLSYVWTLLWSRLFFGEPFTRTKLLGLAMILSGVAMLFAGAGTSKRQQTDAGGPTRTPSALSSAVYYNTR